MEFNPPAVYAVHNPNAAWPVASGPLVFDGEGVGLGDVGSAVGASVSGASSLGDADGVAAEGSELSELGSTPADAATAVPPPSTTSDRAAIATFVPRAVAMNDTSGPPDR